MPWLQLVGVLLAVGGLACLAKMVQLMLAARRQHRTGTTTTGTVLDVREEADPGPVEGFQTAYFPLVEFTDSGGARRQFWNAEKVGPRPEPGSPIKVWYHPGDPNAEPQVVHQAVGLSAGAYLVMFVIFELLAWALVSWS